jgi:8-oxo-dGTP diphosphatase
VSSDLENNPTWMLVVAAALSQPDGRVLMQRRPHGKQHGGLWEFPGGKVEKGESPPFALARELEEELGIVLDPGALEPAGFAQGSGEEANPRIVILLYKAAAWRGEPENREGGEWGWFTLHEASALGKPPLDVALLTGLLAGGTGAGQAQ